MISTQVNAEVAEQDFVVEIHSDMPPASVTAEISRFIGLTRQEPWTVITNWVDKHLSDRQVYMVNALGGSPHCPLLEHAMFHPNGIHRVACSCGLPKGRLSAAWTLQSGQP